MPFYILEHISCIQLLHLIHRMKLLPTPFLQTDHGNLDDSIYTILSSVQKVFMFFTFNLKSFSTIAFFVVQISFLLPSSYLQEAPNHQR